MHFLICLLVYLSMYMYMYIPTMDSQPLHLQNSVVLYFSRSALYTYIPPEAPAIRPVGQFPLYQSQSYALTVAF